MGTEPTTELAMCGKPVRIGAADRVCVRAPEHAGECGWNSRTYDQILASRNDASRVDPAPAVDPSRSNPNDTKALATPAPSPVRGEPDYARIVRAMMWQHTQHARENGQTEIAALATKKSMALASLLSDRERMTRDLEQSRFLNEMLEKQVSLKARQGSYWIGEFGRVSEELEEMRARLAKVEARRDKAKDREDVLTGLAAKYAVVHEDARRRFSVDGAHWAGTPAKAIRAYLDFVTSPIVADRAEPAPAVDFSRSYPDANPLTRKSLPGASLPSDPDHER